jgi:hypothetical protein
MFQFGLASDMRLASQPGSMGEGDVQVLCIARDDFRSPELPGLELSFLVDSCVMHRIYSSHLERSSVALVDRVAGHEAIDRIRSQSREYEQAPSFAIIEDHRNFAEMPQSLRKIHAASRGFSFSLVPSKSIGESRGPVLSTLHLIRPDTFQAHFPYLIKRNRFHEFRGFIHMFSDFESQSLQRSSRI